MNPVLIAIGKAVAAQLEPQKLDISILNPTGIIEILGPVLDYSLAAALLKKNPQVFKFSEQTFEELGKYYLSYLEASVSPPLPSCLRGEIETSFHQLIDATAAKHLGPHKKVILPGSLTHADIYFENLDPVFQELKKWQYFTLILVQAYDELSASLGKVTEMHHNFVSIVGDKAPSAEEKSEAEANENASFDTVILNGKLQLLYLQICDSFAKHSVHLDSTIKLYGRQILNEKWLMGYNFRDAANFSVDVGLITQVRLETKKENLSESLRTLGTFKIPKSSVLFEEYSKSKMDVRQMFDKKMQKQVDMFSKLEKQKIKPEAKVQQFKILSLFRLHPEAEKFIRCEAKLSM